jgi:predicted  nucleic acid-binding Zn-ribbon protein
VFGFCLTDWRKTVSQTKEEVLKQLKELHERIVKLEGEAKERAEKDSRYYELQRELMEIKQQQEALEDSVLPEGGSDDGEGKDSFWGD